MTAEASPRMRPVARSAAVRPHSSFLPLAPARSCAPRPVSAASPCSAALFFAPSPRPIDEQSCLVARLCSQRGWEQSAAWERVGEQECLAYSVAYATVPTVPTLARARVMRVRTCICSLPSLLLGTWEHSLFLEQYQWLALFPCLFPTPRWVGTWEQAEASGLRPHRLSGAANKVEAGYGDPQRADGGARRKFRAPIALELGRDLVDQAQLRADPENGGNRPLAARLAGHVGRVMLEGCGQATDPASFPGACRKLGRLRGSALGELTLLRRSRAPGAPNRGRRSPAMLALHAGGIWIESPFRAGPSDDWVTRSVGKNAQTDTRRRGLGGIRFSKAAARAERTRNREAGKRAGVSFLPAIARPHEAGGKSKLRRDFAAVNGGTSNG